MINYAIQRHLSHILLIDSEPTDTMELLGENALELHREFGELAGVDPYDRYSLHLAFPTAREDLSIVASELKRKFDEAQLHCSLGSVRTDDMSLMQGKAGLLACSLWCLAGAILVNDSVISTTAAAGILSVANRQDGVHVIGEGLHAAVICRQSEIDQRLARLPDGHDLARILQALGASEQRAQPATHASAGASSRAKWWRFWE